MANDIRWVCLSDMHIGEEDAVLTAIDDIEGNGVANNLRASSSLIKLVDGIRLLCEANGEDDGGNKIKPTLILNGDILELALTTTNESAMAFERFIELTMPQEESQRLFNKIIYVVGNHDHHLWEMARESSYVNYLIWNRSTR